jgi:nucleotide-binding universal stress UspA family protein
MSTAPNLGPERIEVVLIPLDGSEFSEWALPVGRWLAERLGAGVHLFSAVPSVDDVDERQAVLEKVDLGDLIAGRTVVVNLDPAGAIHEELRRLGNAVACMASHGRTRSAALVGSVAIEVIARGRDPLVVVGPLVEGHPKGQGIVACIDETPGSHEIIAVGLRWSELLHEPLTVIAVAEPVPEPLRSGPVKRLFGPDGDVDAYLASAVRPFRAEGHEIETVAVYDPIGPGDGICSYVEQRQPALVAVNSHARTGIRLLALGSVAARVVRGSIAPVLMAPRPDISRAGE